MMKKILKKLASPFLGKRRLQSLYFGLYLVSLKGMNFGGGADFASSGELEVLNYVKNKLESLGREAVIFDVGANVGNYSSAADRVLRSLGRGFKIYSFEPSPQTFKKLEENVSPLKSVQPVNAGLSDREATSVLYSDSELSGLASLSNRQLGHLGLEMSRQEEVKLLTTEDFCRQKNIDSIDFLKLDVEGHELAVLAGAKNMLESGKIKFIQFEFGGCNIDSRTFFRDFYNLLNPRYQIFRVLTDGLYPVSAYKETYEIFVTTNYFAALRT